MCTPVDPDLRAVQYIRIFLDSLGANVVKTFRAADLTRHTGDLFEAAAREPVAITKHRKPRFVVMSYDRFAELTRDASQRAYRIDELPAELGDVLDNALDRALEE